MQHNFFGKIYQEGLLPLLMSGGEPSPTGYCRLIILQFFSDIALKIFLSFCLKIVPIRSKNLHGRVFKEIFQFWIILNQWERD